MKSFINTKIAAIILAVIFAVSLIPVIALGFYAAPAADDFAYGASTAAAAQSGSIGDVLETAARNTQNSYYEWQGSFAAVFLMNLQPAIFGEEYYFLTTIITLTALVVGTLVFMYELLVKYLKADFWQYFLISVVILTMTVHFCYDPVESFYWYNGGIYYTFFYSLALILAAAVLHALRADSVFARIALTAASAVLCGIIGGGNYSTALCVMLILALSAALLAVRKDKRAVILLIILAAGATLFFVSVFAPGNSVRQSAVDTGTNPVIAIILSFVLGGYIFFNSFSLPVFIGLAAITPILFVLAKKSAFSFRRPLLFSAVSFGVFCAQCTPPIYGLGISVPERLLNIIYFSFYILVILNIFVWCGFIARRFDGVGADKLSAFVKDNSTAVFSAAVILFAAVSIGGCNIGKSDSGSAEITGLPLGAEAVYELVGGQADSFRETNDKRLEILRSGDITDAVLPRYSQKPYLLFVNDYSDDPSDWRNEAAAQYYHKTSVVLVQE